MSIIPWVKEVLYGPKLIQESIPMEEPTPIKEEVKEDCYNPLLDDGPFSPNVDDNNELIYTFTKVDKKLKLLTNILEEGLKIITGLLNVRIQILVNGSVYHTLLN